MKKILVIAILLLIYVSSYATALEIPAVNISLLNQDPDPVGPGKYVELRFLVYNTQYNTIARNLQIKIEPKYPFYLEEGESDTKTIGDLPAFGSGKNVAVVKFKVRVDDKAVPGENPITIKYRHDNTQWVGQEFNVVVKTGDANIAVVSVETTPKEIKPGEELKMKVKVKNMADSPMRDITLKLDLTFSSALSSALSATERLAAFKALPFAPLGSTSEKKIYRLLPGEEHTFEYDLIAMSDATSQIYKLPIQITYTDDLGKSYTKNDILGIIVGSKPDLSVVIDSSDLYIGKRTGTVSIKFINKGFTDVKFLDVVLGESQEYEILSANEVYIGNVNSDDYETAEFKLFLKNGASKEEKTIKLPLKVEYRDANNRLYTDDLVLDLKVVSAEKLGMKSNSNGFLLVLIVIALVAGFFIVKKRRKSK